MTYKREPRSTSFKSEKSKAKLMKKPLEQQRISPHKTPMSVLDSDLVYRNKRRSAASGSIKSPVKKRRRRNADTFPSSSEKLKNVDKRLQLQPKQDKASTLIRKILESKGDNSHTNSIAKRPNGSANSSTNSEPSKEKDYSSERPSLSKLYSHMSHHNDSKKSVPSVVEYISLINLDSDENTRPSTEANRATVTSSNTSKMDGPSNVHLNQSNKRFHSHASYDDSSEMPESTRSEHDMYVSRRKIRRKLLLLNLLKNKRMNPRQIVYHPHSRNKIILQASKVLKQIVSKESSERKVKKPRVVRRKSIVRKGRNRRQLRKSNLFIKSSSKTGYLIRSNDRIKAKQSAMKFVITEVEPNEYATNGNEINSTEKLKSAVKLSPKERGERENSYELDEIDGSGQSEEGDDSYWLGLCEEIEDQMLYFVDEIDDFFSSNNSELPEPMNESPTSENNNFVDKYIETQDDPINFFVEEEVIVDYIESNKSIQSAEDTHVYQDNCDVGDCPIDRFPIKIVEVSKNSLTCLSAAEMRLNMSNREMATKSFLSSEAIKVNKSTEESTATFVQIKTANLGQAHIMTVGELPSDVSNTSEDVENEGNFDAEQNDDFVVQPTGTPSIFFNSIICEYQVLLLLKTKIYFQGALNIRLIDGQASIFGYELEQNEKVVANSLLGHSYLYLSPSSNHQKRRHNENFKLNLAELSNNFMSSDLEQIRMNFNSSTDAIVLLESYSSNKGIFMIENYMKQTVFPNDRQSFHNTKSILNCQFFWQTQAGLTINPKWNDIGMTSTSRQIIVGGKGVGKSTLLRYLINRNLKKFKKILLVDLDIDKPEMFLPQTVSAAIITEPMLGPGYLRNQSPCKSYLFGNVNVLVSPIKYLKCVLKLLKYCFSCEDFSTIPWVINTMGYNQGFGPELLVAILRALNPTDLIQIQAHRSQDNFDMIFRSEEVNKFIFNFFKEEVRDMTNDCSHSTHIYDTMSKREGERNNVWNISPKDVQFAMILSKLGNMLQGNDNWITDVKPIYASLSDLKIIVVSDDCVNAHMLPNVLNGSLVYLCRKTDDDLTDDNIVDCYGIGVVRAVDMATNRIYLMPSIPRLELQYVNALAVCSIPLPTPITLTQGARVTGRIPYVHNFSLVY